MKYGLLNIGKKFSCIVVLLQQIGAFLNVFLHEERIQWYTQGSAIFAEILLTWKMIINQTKKLFLYALQCILITVVVECKTIIKLVINLNNGCDFKTINNLWDCFWLDRWVWSKFYDNVRIAAISIHGFKKMNSNSEWYHWTSF